MLAEKGGAGGETNSVEALDVFYVRLNGELELFWKDIPSSTAGP